jgi:pimeloyl-ACP methyl ester carboxylesterase
LAHSHAVEDEQFADEFAMLPGNVAEAGIPADRLLPVRRAEVPTPTGRVSALFWGEEPPRVLLLHGGGQNAHTWDTVLAGLGVPALAVDLPGHGHSAWREDHDYSPATNAGTVAAALAEWGVAGVSVVGMSLGGLTALALAGRHPGVATALAVVDVTPGVRARTGGMTAEQRGTTTLLDGPADFASLDAMVDLASAAAPSRPQGSMRRGVVHNAHRLPDGRWTWRYDRVRATSEAFEQLWDDANGLTVPVTLIRGGDSVFVAAEDVAEFRTRVPHLVVDVVPGAGHSVQSDRPRELTGLLRRRLDL